MDRILLLHNALIVLFNKKICNILNVTVRLCLGKTRRKLYKNNNGFAVNLLFLYMPFVLVVDFMTMHLFEE